MAVPDGRLALAAELPEAAQQAEAEVLRAVVPSVAAARHAVQVSEALPSAAVAGLHAVRVEAARPCAEAVPHVVVAERTSPGRPAAARVEARQPLERFGMAIHAF